MSSSSAKDAYARENPSVLAFIGDAVYEVYIRKYVYEHKGGSAETLSNEAVKYVRNSALMNMRPTLDFTFGDY